MPLSLTFVRLIIDLSVSMDTCDYNNYLFVAMQSTDVTYLQQVASILSLNDVSPFEVIHSGLIKQLPSYFTSLSSEMRGARLRTFVQVFVGQPVSQCPLDSSFHCCLSSNDIVEVSGRL